MKAAVATTVLGAALVGMASAGQHALRTSGPADVAGTPNGASGASVALTQSGIDFLTEKVIDPMLVSYMNDLKIDDIDTKVDGIEIKIHGIEPHDFDCSKCAEISLQPGGDLELSIRDFDIKVHSHVTAHYIISTGATCDSKLKDGTVTVGIKVDVGSDGHPTLKSDNVDVSIDSVDLGCDGFAGTIMDALTKVFKDKVIGEISDAVKKAMPDAIDQLSKTLDGVALDIPFTNDFAEIRFELSAAPDVEAEYVSVPVLGTVVPVANPGQVAPYPIPQIPSYDKDEDSYVQVFLSDFTMNSALYTFWAADRLSRAVMPSDIPATFPLQLNTSSLSVVAPGLTAKYPTPVPVLACVCSTRAASSLTCVLLPLLLHCVD